MDTLFLIPIRPGSILIVFKLFIDAIVTVGIYSALPILVGIGPQVYHSHFTTLWSTLYLPLFVVPVFNRVLEKWET